jgi:hypothetical protein
MTDVLGRIDNVLAGDLCPCGAPPTPGSAYCGDDCTPTHIAGDTDTSGAGQYGAQSTPMRWRPDLVTAQDDSGLEKIPTVRGVGVAYVGRHNGTLYSRSRNTWHLRLDDGHRYVGVDVEINHARDATGATLLDDATVDRIRDGWQRLERELGNSWHLEPDTDPWMDAWGNVYGGLYERSRTRAEEREQRFVAHLDGFAAGAIRARPAVTYHHTDEPPAARNGRVFAAPVGADPVDLSEWVELGELTDDGIATYEPSGALTWSNESSNPLADIRSFMQQRSVAASFQLPPETVRSMVQDFNRAAASLRRAFRGITLAHPPEPEHPMLAAIEARRNRNTGPGQRPRAPRQINPRRGR